MLAVGGQNDYADMLDIAFILRMYDEGYSRLCIPNLYNYNFRIEDGDYKNYIQEHMALADRGEPVVCGGIAGGFDEEQLPVGAQCYTPHLISQSQNWGKH